MDGDPIQDYLLNIIKIIILIVLMSIQEDIENSLEVLSKLKEEEGVIIVEGQNDIDSLVNLGINTRIIAVSQYNIFDIIESISEKEVIVLTDFDKKGTFLFKKYVKELDSSGKKVITIYYKELKKYLKKYITGIEQIYVFLERRIDLDDNNFEY